MAFIARRDGICIKCQKQIKSGIDYISWKRTRNGPSTGEAWHYPNCSGSLIPAPVPLERKPPVEAYIHNAVTALVDAMSSRMKAEPDTDALAVIIKNQVHRFLVEEGPAQPSGVDEETVKRIVGSLIKDEISKCMVKTLVIEKDGHEVKKFDLAHEDLPTLIKLAGTRGPSGHRLNLYMHGPAGSGKSTAARQVAEALGLRFGYSSLNPMTPDSRALGFIHAGGDYVSTEFFKCYTEGGVFCFDEIDNASAGFVTTLNSALENGHGAFPHGVYARHKDFLCVCTANTIGRGGDIHYPERRALDSAFLERFIFVEWGYDKKLTRAIVGGILGEEAAELISWVDDKAAEYQARFPELVISPRAYIQSALLKAQGFAKTSIEAMAIKRGLKCAN